MLFAMDMGKQASKKTSIKEKVRKKEFENHSQKVKYNL